MSELKDTSNFLTRGGLSCPTQQPTKALAIAVVLLAFVSACSDDAPDTGDTTSDNQSRTGEPRPSAEPADDQPVPVAQATVEFEGIELDLDVFGCTVMSHFQAETDSPQGLANIEFGGVRTGVDVRNPGPGEAYNFLLQLQESDAGESPYVMRGDNNDGSWAFNTMAITPDDFAAMQTTIGSIRIDGERLDLTTGATASLLPRPGTDSLINPGTGAFEIEISTHARNSAAEPTTPLKPIRIELDGRCEISWRTF